MSVWDESQRSGLVILTTGVQKIRRKIPLSFSHFKAEQAQPNHSYNIPFNGALRKERKIIIICGRLFFFVWWFVAVVCSNPKATGLVFLHISHV